VVFDHEPPTLASYQPGVARVVALDKELIHRDEFLGEIRERLLQAQDFMKQSYDKGHRDVTFEVDDWVWLRLHQRSVVAIKDKAAAKLAPQFYGPYEVLERIGSLAYRLRLPAKARIHDVFHVAYLKKFERPTAPIVIAPLPLLVHGRAIPVPAQVVHAHPTLAFWDILVHWVGRDHADATWEEL
jgi:hypothetical protein